jgi:diguanylate cyclase (GGDEF)-like protein/PAS domain S-box-containing protein
MATDAQLLLVMPDPTVRARLRQTLEQEDLRSVSEVKDGRAAIDSLRSGRVDALITDIALDHLDGWRLARLVRSGVFPTREDIPILVVSRAYSERIAEATAKEHEINTFLTLDQAQSQLGQKVRDCLAGSLFQPWRSRLLVIEDYPDTAQLAERVLGKRFEIELAADGEAGLQAWRERRHDLVLLDVMLPKKSGPAVLREILAEHPSQAVVIMTAYERTEHACELMLEGAVDFIAKPFRAEQLRRVCNIAVRRTDYLVSNEQFADYHEALFREKERAQIALESIGDGVICTDREGRIDYMNPAAELITGWPLAEARRQRPEQVTPMRWLHSQTPMPNHPLRQCLRERRTIKRSQPAALRKRDGSELEVTLSTDPIHSRTQDVVGAVLIVHDVSLDKRLARRPLSAIEEKPLVGLISHSEMELRLQRALENARTDGTQHAVCCYIMLEGFQAVNETCGLLAGEALLRQITGHWRNQIRDRDGLSRLGSDDFVLLLEGYRLEDARSLCDGMRQTVEGLDFTWAGQSCPIEVSIGMSPLTAADSVAEVLQAAHRASLASRAGRVPFRSAAPDLAEKSVTASRDDPGDSISR